MNKYVVPGDVWCYDYSGRLMFAIAVGKHMLGEGGLGLYSTGGTFRFLQTGTLHAAGWNFIVSASPDNK